jgi:hypothetical protein
MKIKNSKGMEEKALKAQLKSKIYVSGKYLSNPEIKVEIGFKDFSFFLRWDSVYKRQVTNKLIRNYNTNKRKKGTSLVKSFSKKIFFQF